MTWQPIATAPKDGTRVLPYRPTGTVFVAFWAEEWEEWHDGRALFRDPTHWMPLPAPPADPQAMPTKEQP